MRMRMRTWLVSLAICMSAFLSLFAARSEEALLFDFESPQQAFENADKLAYVPEHATQGKLAGKIKLDTPFNPNLFFFGGSNQGGKWGDYDQFIYDVFVEGGAVKVAGFVRDDGGQGWDKRHNFEYKLMPGKGRLTFSLGALTRENGTGNLNLKKMDFFAIQFESEDPKKVATLYLDNARLVKGTGSFEVKTLFSFEGDDKGKLELEDYPDEFKGKSAMATVEEHASAGKKALRLDSRAPAGNVQFSGFEKDWSKYDSLCLDIFNPADKPLAVEGWIKAKKENAGWGERYNYERILKPGFNTVKLSVGGMTGPDGGKPIDTSDIVKFSVATDRQTVFIDNIRLVKGVEEIPVAGLKKFCFGPKASATMPGFTAVTQSSGYDKGNGFGWLPGGAFGRDFDMNEMLGRHRPPDDLCRKFCQPVKATFAIDVPNGTYGVWVMLGPPGNGWGPFFKHRAIAANGKAVFDQSFDIKSFKEYEYQFQDEEDLPGEDLWEKYINKLFRPARFDAEVADGQLKLDFDGGGEWWSAMVNGIAIWPKASQKDAERWLANLDAQRKEQFQSLHVEKIPEAKPYTASDADKARGYALFAHSPDEEIRANTAPAPERTKNVALSASGSPGEGVTVCLAAQLFKDLGQIGAASCSVKNGDKELSAQVRVMRYKALNETAVYEVLPRYLDDVSAASVSLKAGITRSFWVTFQLPADAAAGEYQGQLKLSGSQIKELVVPVKLTVWPIKLAEPTIPVGMFGVGPMQSYLGFNPGGEEYWQIWKQVLDDTRAHGLTSLDPAVALPLKRITGGKAEIDFTAMDRFMEMAKAAGFNQELNGYWLDSGFRLKAPVDYDGEARRFGAANYGALVKAYFDAVRDHAKEKGWLPICFCTDDEFIAHGNEAAKLAAHHRLVQENAPGFHFVAFDSAYLEEKPESRAEREKVLADIDTWGAGLHGPREAEVMKKANRRLWLYNGGLNRFTTGLYLFFAHEKYNVQGMFQWIYYDGGTYTGFYLASFNEANFGVVWPSTRGMRSTPTWERMRAGCFDLRYLETAKESIEKAKASGKGAAEAKALQSIIDAAFGRLTFGKANADALSGEGKADNPMTPEGMDALRRAVAEGIVKLQNAGVQP